MLREQKRRTGREQRTSHLTHCYLYALEGRVALCGYRPATPVRMRPGVDMPDDACLVCAHLYARRSAK